MIKDRRGVLRCDFSVSVDVAEQRFLSLGSGNTARSKEQQERKKRQYAFLQKPSGHVGISFARIIQTMLDLWVL